MTDRLTLYNNALREGGERKLASLTEDRGPRHALDDIWNSGTFIKDVLGDGFWRFARRTVLLDHETDFQTTFGHAYAFTQPTDFVRTVALCTDERLKVPLLDYKVEAGFWYADVDPIYLTYVSSDASYGGDLTKWPEEFCRYAELYLAWRVQPRLTGSKADRLQIAKDMKKAKTYAKSNDAAESPTQFPPPGTWTSSRGARRGGERGNLSRLIG